MKIRQKYLPIIYTLWFSSMHYHQCKDLGFYARLFIIASFAKYVMKTTSNVIYDKNLISLLRRGHL